MSRKNVPHSPNKVRQWQQKYVEIAADLGKAAKRWEELAGAEDPPSISLAYTQSMFNGLDAARKFLRQINNGLDDFVEKTVRRRG